MRDRTIDDDTRSTPPGSGTEEVIRRVRRRDLLRAGVAVAVAGVAGRWLAPQRADAIEPLTHGRVPGRPGRETLEERIERLLREYDALGIHRTGTPVDDAGAEWLLDELRRAGVPAELQRFPFRRFDPGESYVEAVGRRMSGTPLFDSPLTGPGGVTGPLGREGVSGSGIGLYPIPTTTTSALGPVRREGRHSAIIAVSGSKRRGLSLLNAEKYGTPFGPPTVQLPAERLPFLLAAEGLEARVVTTGSFVDTRAANVFGTVRGRFPEMAPVIVMTPRSSWWHSTGERGGGIAVWLEMARALAVRPPKRTVHFLASTGHELGHAGLEHFLEQDASRVAGAHLWVHLGANFGAKTDANSIIQAADKSLEWSLEAGVERAGVPVGSKVPPGKRPLGEARQIQEGGGRFISLLGSQGLFHHPDDRHPNNTDVPRIARLATSLTGLVVDLTR